MSAAPVREKSRSARALVVVLTLLVASSLLAGCTSSGAADAGGTPSGSAASADVNLSDVTLTFGFQTADYPALLEASGLFKDLPYKLDTPVISGPAAQLSALYSKATDVGLVGENTAAFEAANADDDWNQTGPVIQTIAGISAVDAPYPAPSLFVRKSAGIKQLSDLRGKKVAYNFGGNIYAGYVMTLYKAGLTVNDIEPVQLPDNQAATAAFVNGDVDAVIGGYTMVRKVVDSGEAERLVTNTELGIAGGAGFITRTEVLNDPGKLAAIKDFFGRFAKLYRDWYPKNEAAVVKIYTDTLKQTPDLAELNWKNGEKTRFYKVGTPEFIAQEQLITDQAYKAAGVKNQRDIKLVFNGVLDPIVVPAT
jgi:sulfonate transport system substrate-binding protein